MVSSVSNSLGSTAYLKSSSLGNNGNAARLQQQQEQSSAKETTEAETSAPVRETDKTERTEADNDNGKKDTQLEERHDDTTIQAEAQRGSLLDIAV